MSLKDLDADILILPELWRADDGPDFYDDLSTSLAMTGAFAPLATRRTSDVGRGALVLAANARPLRRRTRPLSSASTAS